MKNTEEIKILAKKIADIELDYKKSYNRNLMIEVKNLIDDCSIEELDLLDDEIKKILKDKND